MPAVNHSGRGGGSTGRRGFSYRSLPLWLQWVLPLGVAAILVVALIVFVNHQTNDVPTIANVTSPKAIAEQNREDRIIVRQQQAPHVARLAAGQSSVAGLRAAVVRYMSRQISQGAMDGPIRRVTCRSLPGGTSAREVMRCRVAASDVTYPFDAVVRPSAGVITYCQRVQPPVPSMNIPVSGRCS